MLPIEVAKRENLLHLLALLTLLADLLRQWKLLRVLKLPELLAPWAKRAAPFFLQSLSLERLTRASGSIERLIREAHSRGSLERLIREAHPRG